MAFTIGSGTFTNGSATVTGVTLTSGTLAYFASGTRMVVGVNPVIQEVEAIAAPTVTTITLRSAWTGTGGTYSFLANQTSEGLRDAVQAIRANNASLQSFIDSIDTAATADSVAQRTSDGSLNVTDLNASRNAFIGTTDSNSARLTATSGSGSCIYGNSVSVFSRESGTVTQSIIGMNQTGVDAPFIDFRKDGVTVGNIGTSSGDIYFGSGSSGTERMRIDSSGNVGIGVSNPLAKLHCSSDGSGQVTSLYLKNATGTVGSGTAIDFDVTSSNNTQGRLGVIRTNAANFESAMLFSVNDAAGALSERMRIDSSGRVGIGTSSPQTNLVISDTSNPTLRLDNADTTLENGQDIGSIEFYTNDPSAGGTGLQAEIFAVSESNFGTNQDLVGLGFSTSLGGQLATERMRIDSSGNVLVGSSTSLDAAKLLINYNSAPNNGLVINDTNSGDGAGAIKFLSGGSLRGAIRTIGSRIAIASDSGSSGSGLFFDTSGSLPTNRLSTVTDNQFSLGSASYRWATVYAATGSINTSDAREKTPVDEFTADELNAAKQLSKEIGTYKFLSAVAKKGDDARKHIGMTVQRAIEIMEANNLDPFAYGFICYDKWEEQTVDHPAVEAVEGKGAWTETIEHEAELDENGEVIKEAWAEVIEHEAVEAVEAKNAYTEVVQEAGDRYSFRPDEMLFFIARGLEARIEALEG